MVCVQCFSDDTTSQPSDVIEVCNDYHFTPATISWSNEEDRARAFEEFVDSKDSVMDHVSRKKIRVFLPAA